MTITERVQAPTPKFFRKVRTGGLIMATIGAALFAAPGSLPPILIKLAGYLTVAGSVATAVSQVTTNQDAPSTDGSKSVVPVS